MEADQMPAFIERFPPPYRGLVWNRFYLAINTGATPESVVRTVADGDWHYYLAPVSAELATYHDAALLLAELCIERKPRYEAEWEARRQTARSRAV